MLKYQAKVLIGSAHTKVQLNLDLQKLWYKNHIQSDKTNQNVENHL